MNKTISLSLPQYKHAHAFALSGALLLHSTIAAIAMMPSAPTLIPEQQIIQVSMVAPSIVQQKPTPLPVVKEQEKKPIMPPKEKGMVKAKPKPEPVKQAEVKQAPEPKPVAQPVQQTEMTSGIAAADATAKTSAFTQPIPANYLNNPPPKYPARARQRKEQGTVLIDVFVSTEGTAKKVAIGKSSGVSLLDDAALEAVKQWKFVPARRGSELVEANVLVPVKFKLN